MTPQSLDVNNRLSGLRKAEQMEKEGVIVSSSGGGGGKDNGYAV
jgi:hypothetical protein